jgi:hypothetical protein
MRIQLMMKATTDVDGHDDDDDDDDDGFPQPV